MKRKAHKGLSLVEVMMALVLVGFLILMVSGAVTSSYQTAVSMQKLPGLYYKGQQEIEGELDELEDKITTKYLYEKELGKQAEQDPALLAALDELNEELESEHEKLTVTLFGKDVIVYQFEREVQVEGLGEFTLFAGTASGVRLERPVPVIDRVSANLVGQSVSDEAFNAVGQILSTEVSYSDTNADYRFTELYQWYISTGGQHTVYYDDGTPGPDEIQHGVLLPVYPADFTLISSERTATMAVRDEYIGHFVCCLVTPLSINGKMGEAVLSNLIYLSELPVGPSYKAVIDASLLSLPYDESGWASLSSLNGTSAAGGSFIAKAGRPKASLAGELFSEDAAAASRFIRFEAGVTMKSSSVTPKNGDVLFAVVRSLDAAPKDFIKVGSRAYGYSNAKEILGPSEGGWRIVRMSVTQNGTEYTLDGGRFDLAELIIASGPSTQQIGEIMNYLSSKYGISS